MKKSILSFLVYIIGVSPVFAQTYQELSDRAIACTEQDSLAQAENYIRQALKLEPANPHNALLFSNLGTIQRRQRDYDQALESYTYALNIAPRAVPILLNRAALNLEMGRKMKIPLLLIFMNLKPFLTRKSFSKPIRQI